MEWKGEVCIVLRFLGFNKCCFMGSVFFLWVR